MSKFTRLTPEQREELVAYLDGELDPSLLETVESTLSKNQVARHDLNQLSKTYDLLNFLPRVTPDPELSRKTLGRIEAKDSQLKPSLGIDLSRMRRYTIGIVWFLVLSATAIAAFQFSQEFREDPTKLLLEDLPVIEKVDRYSEVNGEYEFLQKLHEEGIFEEKNGGVAP